ncbi:MAG: hypothetical protein PUF72_04135 [Clostridiales bacterium]|nr:hypothetical protein [Clostridiales bacterium]
MYIELHTVQDGGWVFNGNFPHATAELKRNQWARAVFDFTDAIETTYKDIINDRDITQLRLHPFADSDGTPCNTWRVAGNSIYIKDLYYTDVKPSDYIAEIHHDKNGNAYAYVSENGYVTIGEQNIGAYQTVESAFNALGKEEATVYISGEVNEFNDVSGRGKVLVRGLGDTEEDIANNKLSGTWTITGGDITFDYLTMSGGANSSIGEANSLYSTGSTITIGSNVVTTDTMFAGLGNAKITNARKMVFNGGTWQSVAAGTNYSGGDVDDYCGAVEYIFNGGTFYSVYGGSKENWEWSHTDVKGDVNYTFNGGFYYGSNMYLGSNEVPHTVEGNITWNVNGGYMEGRRIVGGDQGMRTLPSWGGYDKSYPLKNTAVMVNNKNLTPDDSITTLTLGTTGKGLNIGGKEIYIINNYEKNTGTKIDPASTAQYRMHVYNGSAAPVYAETTEGYGGDLLGFTLTADKAGAVPYLNGEKLVAENGVYNTIPENTTAGEITEIVFAEEGGCAVSMNTSDSTVTAKVFNFTGADKNMMLLVGQYNGAALEKVYKAEKAVANTDVLKVDGITKEEGKTYRAFIWDTNMTPYLPVTTF